ncbi:APC family permease [soil metagenome]
MTVAKFSNWLMAGHKPKAEGPYAPEETQHKTHAWWQVMCLTGVDYFSTLGYQPGIAALAAGVLSPLATLILVIVTLFGALPIYSYVARESPHGEGSIAMLESLLIWWQGKLFVLALLGFVATDFIITITLSAADATAHVLENPLLSRFVPHQPIWVTLGLISLLGAVFIKGFKEAVGIAVWLVLIYLGLNVIVVGRGILEVMTHGAEVQNWWTALTTSHGGNPALIAATALLLFPKLALGLSGFETGVVVMPLVKGDKSDHSRVPQARIVNTRKLLGTAAIIMSFFLLGSSFVTVVHIPLAEFREADPEKGIAAGAASGRALAYLAHQFFGDGFGTLYDLSTICILWFAGASAMAGLLNVVPKYLPRYGMAPEWTRASRPLVLLFIALAFAVTIIFKADVVAQGGAYATGVLVLMSSAAVAVTISAKRHRLGGRVYAYGVISFVFIYTTIVNMVERPDGLKIASFFIGTILLVSLVSRIWRTLELRVDRVEMDGVALNIVREAAEHWKDIRIVPNHPEEQNILEYERETLEARRDHQIPEDQPLIFLEIEVKDASDFSGIVRVKGYNVGGHYVLRAQAAAIPNAIAAIMIHIQRLTDKRPHAYFNWGERNPFYFLVNYFLSGEGDIAPVTREILRRVQKNPEERPLIHAAG